MPSSLPSCCVVAVALLTDPPHLSSAVKSLLSPILSAHSGNTTSKSNHGSLATLPGLPPSLPFPTSNLEPALIPDTVRAGRK